MDGYPVKCLGVTALLLFLLLAAAPATAKPEELTSGRYHASIAIDPPDGQDIFTLTRDGVPVFKITDANRLCTGHRLQAEDEARLPDDINGDGIADLVVFGWSGGAHCCFKARVLSLGDDFRLLAEIQGWNEEPVFRQLDDDPALEVVVQDASFDYWPDSHGGAPFVYVALDWRDDGYAPSAGLTTALQPDRGDLAVLAEGFRTGKGWQYRFQYWGDVFARALELMFAGRTTEASTFIEAAWGGTREDLVRLFVEFSDRLARSPYYSAIVRDRALEATRPPGGSGSR